MSLSARRAWIEIKGGLLASVSSSGSLSARRAWIEMVCFNVIDHSAHVALRKESVDRNIIVSAVLLMYSVALRKESVDRNQGVHYDNYNLHWSLSARRAWIEISIEEVSKYVVKGRSPQGERG